MCLHLSRVIRAVESDSFYNVEAQNQNFLIVPHIPGRAMFGLCLCLHNSVVLNCFGANAAGLPRAHQSAMQIVHDCIREASSTVEQVRALRQRASLSLLNL